MDFRIVLRLSVLSHLGGRHSGGGEVRVVHQNHEDEKNSSEFFEANAEAPKNVMKNDDFYRAQIQVL